MAEDLDILSSKDILYSTDLIERFEELESEIEDAKALYEQGGGNPDEWETEDTEEYEKLSEVCREGESMFGREWTSNMTLVRDSYWQEYAEGVAGEFGIDVYDGLDWPLCHIDWNAAAESLQMDYSSFEIEGVTYWARG